MRRAGLDSDLSTDDGASLRAILRVTIERAVRAHLVEPGSSVLPSIFVAPARWVWSRAWILLTFTAAVWAGNGVAARMATGQVSPMSLVFLRWFIVCLILCFLLRRQALGEFKILLKSWRRVLLLGFFGFTAFNTLYYLAAYRTTAVNLTLLQSTTPVLVLAGAAIFLRARVTPLQIIGMMISFLGVGLISTQGDITRIFSMSFNIGDIGVLVACVFYAGYTLALRKRPNVSALVFFAGLSLAACLTSIPLFVAEIVAGHSYWPSFKGWLILVFIAFGPSLVSQLTYIRGIELIGPARAGLFNNLVPLFGALFAVAILGEPFATYHAIALALGLGGIYLAESRHGR